MTFYPHAFICISKLSAYVPVTFFITYYMYVGSVAGCNSEVDAIWGIEWPFTPVSTVAIQICSGLNEPAGKKLKIITHTFIIRMYMHPTMAYKLLK